MAGSKDVLKLGLTARPAVRREGCAVWWFRLGGWDVLKSAISAPTSVLAARPRLQAAARLRAPGWGAQRAEGVVRGIAGTRILQS
jgi:hypothetical protein